MSAGVPGRGDLLGYVDPGGISELAGDQQGSRELSDHQHQTARVVWRRLQGTARITNCEFETERTVCEDGLFIVPRFLVFSFLFLISDSACFCVFSVCSVARSVLK